MNRLAAFSGGLPSRRATAHPLVPYEVTDRDGQRMGTVDLPEGTDLAVVHCVARRYWHDDFSVRLPRRPHVGDLR